MAENPLNRRFHTPLCLLKLATDMTEFKGGEKLYLSSILDLYNGEIISYGISRRHTLDFILEPQDQVVETIKNEAEYRATIRLWMALSA
ncbi:hypothetical protein [Bacillus sp. FJAT-27916]|uniref:hypothetical protein n=1 Tax=Bacillus sp. FJAT-27916 TaxID=1679169 RepID=UPI0012E10FE4|nr:hypothetical protein [Bacillus sp. FJAT-27916]